jgi:integrase
MTDLVPRPEGGPEGEEKPPGAGAAPAEGATAVAQRLKALVLDTVSSDHSRRAYEKALDDFLTFLGGRPFTRASLQEFRSHMEAAGLAPASINLRLAPLRKLATEAAENGWMDPMIAGGIARVRGVRRLGLRVGKWATAEEATALLQAPDASSVKGKRDRAILAVLIGCALRRGELVGLTVADLQQRDGRGPDLPGGQPVGECGGGEALYNGRSRDRGRVRLSPLPPTLPPRPNAARARNSAGSTGGPSSRSNSSWDTPLSRRPSATWAGSRSSRWRSTTSWG